MSWLSPLLDEQASWQKRQSRGDQWGGEVYYESFLSRVFPSGVTNGADAIDEKGRLVSGPTVYYCVGGMMVSERTKWYNRSASEGLRTRS